MKYISILFCVLLFTACRYSKRGSGNIVTETRKTSNFTAIDAAGPIHVQIKKGTAQSVTVQADDNIMRLVETTVTGNTLNIKLRKINNLRNATINVTVVVTEFTEASASASAEIKSEETIGSDSKINLTASSAAKIEVKLNVPAVNVNASSGADIDLAGNTKNIQAEASSGSQINAAALKAENAKGNASSGADIKLFGSVSIDASASSGGQVNYTGGAANVIKNVSSGGGVNERN